MNIPLIIFFVSLLAIVYMLGRKFMALSRASSPAGEDDAIVINPDLESIQYIAVKNLKKYGYVLMLVSLRLSLRTGKWIKDKWYIILSRFQSNRDMESTDGEKEISNFLQNISDYKKKIKEMKEKIKREEGLE